MEHETLVTKFKSFIASIGWKLFIWGEGKTEEEYWDEIYEQEKYWRMNNHKPL